ncbi:MAG TPA: RidA family protein [Thermoanaerobaculia bacterium]|nr:RidA family protein [Thermoanaerobaculia bacterium]
MTFERVFTGTPWEPRVGYCRAVKAGSHVHVSGCAPVAPGTGGDADKAGDAGGVFAPGDAYAQARRCLEIALDALGQLGASAADVVRTRMFVTDISRWQEYGRAHGEVFAEHPPVTTMVEVRSLIDPAMLIEIEVDAYLGGR